MGIRWIGRIKIRCQCCNINLSDYESRLKHPDTGEYLDICLKCLPDTTITPVAPKELEKQYGYDDQEDDWHDDFDIEYEDDERS